MKGARQFWIKYRRFKTPGIRIEPSRQPSRPHSRPGDRLATSALSKPQPPAN